MYTFFFFWERSQRRLANGLNQGLARVLVTWLWLKKPVPQWLALVSGNMGTKTCGLPLFKFEPHPHVPPSSSSLGGVNLKDWVPKKNRRGSHRQPYPNGGRFLCCFRRVFASDSNRVKMSKTNQMSTTHTTKCRIMMYLTQSMPVKTQNSTETKCRPCI